jgi:hypothetical protein
MFDILDTLTCWICRRYLSQAKEARHEQIIKTLLEMQADHPQAAIEGESISCGMNSSGMGLTLSFSRFIDFQAGIFSDDP